MEYYNNNIQLHKKVIDDIFSNIQPNTRMLVFGLGYDSKMWYEGNNRNTFFIENNDKYITLNSDIPSDHIFKYNYQTTCNTCMQLTSKEIESFVIPEEISNLAPFDIILIDGPEGWTPDKPGRFIPCYWAASFLSKSGTLIYIDDSNREVETFCIQKFFHEKYKYIFLERGKCTKIII